MSRSFGLSVVAGFASGVIFLSALSGGALGVLLIYLVPLPLVMVGLSHGLAGSMVAAAASLILVAVVSLSGLPTFAVMAVLPSLLLVRQALLWRQSEAPEQVAVGPAAVEWYPPGLILAWLTGAAAVLLLLGAGLLVVQGVAIEETVRHHVSTFFDEMAFAAPAEMRDRLVSIWTAFMPALAACAWLLMAVANGMLAQWTVTKAGHARRPTPGYGDLWLPAWTAIALVTSGAVGLLATGDVGYIACNMAVVLLVPYVFVGLAAVHEMVRAKPNAGVILVVFYTVFFILFGWGLLAVAGLGLVRHWTRLRRSGAGSQEEK